MARRKAIKIPFLKLKLKSSTVYGIFSLVLLLVFILLMMSFNQQAKVLNVVHEWLISNFGRVAILFPMNFLFASGAMVQSKKLKIIKVNWFLGYTMVFLASLIVLRTGSLGESLAQEVDGLLSPPGTLVTFSFVLLVGVLLAFEISLPDFVKWVAKGVSWLFGEIGKVLKNTFKNKEEKEKDKKSKNAEFVGDMAPLGKLLMKKPETALAAKPVMPQALADNTLMRNVSKTSVGLNWKFPPLTLLNVAKEKEAERGDVKRSADAIEEALDSFGIKARVADVNYGPAVTQYALQIAKGVKLNKITSLSNNLALALAAPHGLIRIEAPIPGKSLVGIEVPNIKPQVVPLRQMLSGPQFGDRTKLLQVPMGLDVAGLSQSIEINDMPHILIAGTTGSGKSVLLSAWVATLLFRTTPDELRLILIDPKRVTFMPFDGIPHLLTNVITDPKDTLSALKYAVKEMEERYKILAESKMRDLASYNKAVKEVEKKMYYIVIIIDELADLMMHAAKEVEDSITRIAQKARAVGIYLVIATQRPSVDVITGLMKANIPARIAFNVSSMIDSRVIIDMPGAEKLLGRGDMLFISPNASKPTRIQGPFIADEELQSLVDFLKQNQQVVHYTEEVTKQEVKTMVDSSGNVSLKSSDKDPLFNDAVNLVYQAKKASASLLQRKFSIGYSRAARILDDLERAGIVGPSEGSKPREILVSASAVQEEGAGQE